jgi:hypothetical protein
MLSPRLPGLLDGTSAGRGGCTAGTLSMLPLLIRWESDPRFRPRPGARERVVSTRPAPGFEPAGRLGRSQLGASGSASSTVSSGGDSAV